MDGEFTNQGEALHSAVTRADLKTIRQLIAAGASTNALDAAGMPPIAYVLDHYTAYGFVLTPTTREMIQLLRAADADPALGGAREHVISLASSMVMGASETADCGILERLLA